MSKRSAGVSDLLLASFLVLLCGCGTSTSVAPSASFARERLAAAGKQGLVRSGHQPVSGATIQLYAVGTTGDGSAAKPLLSPAPTTATDGSFAIAGTFTCPSSETLVYLVATGGDPIPSPGTTNPALAMMTVFGPCGQFFPSTFITINELTTVAAVNALAPYMHSYSAVGSHTGYEVGLLTEAFALADAFVNPGSGTAPGTAVPQGATVPVQQLNTLADIVATCIDSAGGKAGDGSACGKLFALTVVPAGAANAPTDTIGALLGIVASPSVNVGPLYDLILPGAPYQPALPQEPPDLAVRLVRQSGLTVSPSSLSFPPTPLFHVSSLQTLTITNNTGAPVAISAADPSTLFNAGADPADFSTVGQPPLYQNTSTCYGYSPLPAGASCTVQISFEPMALGPRSAYYVLKNSSPNPSIAIPLSGIGVAESSGSVNLSTYALNLQSGGAPGTLTATNLGSAPVTIEDIEISNDPTSGRPAFTQTNTCGQSVAAGTSCTITVTPLTITQPYATGVLIVRSDSASGPVSAQLTNSNGFAGPLLLTFPGLSVGTSLTDNLSLGSYLNPVTLTITGPDATDFSFSATSSTQTLTCNASRNNPSCFAPITFTPSGLGTRTATVNANGSPAGGFVGTGLSAGAHFAFVTGNGPNTLTPTNSLKWQGTIGQPTSDFALILNTGTVPLTLNAPVITGPAAGDFSASINYPASSCAPTLAPRATCLLDVTSNAAQAGPRTATLTLTDSTGAATGTLQLSSQSYLPPPFVTPATIDFGYVPVNKVSAAKSFTITAPNNDPVSVVDPSAATDPFVLNRKSCPKTPCTITVRYEPTPGTSYGGAFYIYDQITYESTLFNAMGTTVPPYVLSATPTSLYFPTPSPDIYSGQNVGLTNSGSQDLPISLAFNRAGTVTTNQSFSVGTDGGFVGSGQSDPYAITVVFLPPSFVHGKVTATLWVLSQAKPLPIQLTGIAP